jgi:8-oxo-dGTP pyrophosphatase MutT (NUDIX family)
VARPAGRTDRIRHRYAGVFLLASGKRVVGQRRDDIPSIDNPGKVAAFGGTVEEGEDPRSAAWRELTQEETNLRLSMRDIHGLTKDIAWRELTAEWEVRFFFYAAISDRQLDSLEVFEGAGWALISGPDDPDLIDSWRDPTRLLFEMVAEERGN